MGRGANTGGDEIREFWKNVAEKRGGEASSISYGRYLGRTGEPAERDFTGLVYIAAGRLWFETVESRSTFFGFLAPDGPLSAKYEPLEFCIPLGDVAGADRVSFADARAAMKLKGSGRPPRPLGPLAAFFVRSVLRVALRDGGSVYFEAAEDGRLAAALSEKRTGA